MFRVTLWLQLVLVVLILRQSAAVSDQCSELQEEEISRWERDIEHQTKQLLISQCTARKLKQSEVVNSGLKKQLEVKEEVLKINNETQTQLQATIVGLTKTVESLNQTIQRLCETPEHVCQYLFDAAGSGYVGTAKILFKCSNDSCIKNNFDRDTPLTYAAEYGHVEVVRVLLEGGANVDRANAHYSALHVAAIDGRLDLGRLLLDWGAQVDPLEVEQNTPLHAAAFGGHLSLLKLLVERGADVSLKNSDGQTASDVARGRRHKDAADWLDSVKRG